MGGLRLIYFTVDKSPVPGFFKGLPTPAAALLVTAPLLMLMQGVSEGANDIRFWALFCAGLMAFTALLMNAYPIRYLHYGRFMNRRPLFSGIIMVAGFAVVFTPYFGHFALLCMILYVLSPLWTWKISPEIAARET
jgi:phosphatidylserine synthase